jgi:hypothetical protein
MEETSIQRPDTISVDNSGYTPSDPILIPVMDMLNHRPNHPVTWLTSPSQITFIAETEYPANTEIFNNYGSKGNEECTSSQLPINLVLMGYGFCLRDNPHDSISLKLPNDETLYMITPTVLAPDNLISKFREVVSNPRECGRVTRRNTSTGYSALIRALVQKLAGIGWEQQECDSPAGEQIGICRSGQLELLMSAYNHVVGLYAGVFRGITVRYNSLRRGELQSRKRVREEPDMYMAEWIVLVLERDGKEYSPLVKEAIGKMEEYYKLQQLDREFYLSQGLDEDTITTLDGEIGIIQKRLRKKKIKNEEDKIRMAMRMWEEESVEEIGYPDIYKVVERLNGCTKEIVNELHGEPIDLVIFIDDPSTNTLP